MFFFSELHIESIQFRITYFHLVVVHLGNVDVHLGEELVQMLGVVVPEDVLGHAAVLDPLNHRSMVAGIRENLTTLN